MKFFILLFFIFPFFRLQSQGVIICKENTPISGTLNTYFYKPPKYLIVPNKIYASVVYQSEKQYYHKSITINKNNGNYTFLLRVPDSTQVLIITVIDEENKSVDDNNGLGFTSYLYNKNGIKSASSYIQAAYMLSYFAPRMLHLNWIN
ncbi:MAG: hypothetical protein M3Z26_17595 [Bacteroidota bacterium]|nr:hypothetical protein [Bacteroidota bacterium]